MITTQEVKKIAKLAKLNVQDNEITEFASQLTNIMEMIDQLNEVDCNNVEPLTSVCDMNQRMRKDEITVGDIASDLFANATGESAELAKEIKYFIVPKIIE